MKTIKNSVKGILFAISGSLLLNSCAKNENIDQEAPEIQTVLLNENPVQCAQIERGKTFKIQAIFTDNFALGSYSLDLHHNFDHHSHSTNGVECQHEEEKEAVLPFVFIRTFDLLDGLKSIEVDQEIFVPENVDTGNYHLTLKVVDKMGWSQVKSFSVQII